MFREQLHNIYFQFIIQITIIHCQEHIKEKTKWKTLQFHHMNTLFVSLSSKHEACACKIKKKVPSNTLLFDDVALQARSWRQIVSSTAFKSNKPFPSSSPLKGRPYVMVKRSSSCYQTGNRWIIHCKNSLQQEHLFSIVQCENLENITTNLIQRFYAFTNAIVKFNINNKVVAS